MSTSFKKNGRPGYYTMCLMPVDDYYTGGEKEPPGRWYFAPNKQGVRGEFDLVDGKPFNSDDVDAFHQLGEGFNPAGGAKLVQNAGKKRCALMDLTFSNMKSASVVWSQTDGELKNAIEESHHQSVRRALDFASEKGAYSRQVVREKYRDKNGEVRTRRKVLKAKTSFVGALFDHGSSRADDPQMHTHATILNVCIREDGSTGALESLYLMKWQGAVASLYHAAHARDLQTLGCKIVPAGSLWEIAGVPKEACEHFSKRSQDIKHRVEQKQRELGLTPDAARASRGLIDAAVIETRDGKNEKTRDQLQAEWLQAGIELGFSQAEALEVFELGKKEPIPTLTADELREEALKAVNERLLAHEATFGEPALVTAVAVQLTGRASVEDILSAVESVKPLLVFSNEIDEDTGDAEPVYTTREMLLIERDLQRLVQRKMPKHRLDAAAVEAAIAAKDSESRDAAVADFVKRHHRQPDADEIKGLEAEQMAAVRHLCLSENFTSVMEGTAGAGKTFTVGLVADIYKTAGYKVHGLAGQWTQSQNLQVEAQLDSGTAIAKWLHDVKAGNIVLTADDVILVDEAGMVGVRDMHMVAKLAEASGAKLVLLGDTLQQSAVAAGDALRTVASVTGSARLNVIRRQIDELDRLAVPQFFAGDAAAGLKHYIERGQLKISAGAQQTCAALVADWQADRVAVRNREALEPGRKPTSTLIIAARNDEVRMLNRMAHDARREAGELGESVTLRTMDSTDKDDLVEFSVGDQVVFRINNKNLAKGAKARLDKSHEATLLKRYRTGTNKLTALEPHEAQAHIRAMVKQFAGDRGNDIGRSIVARLELALAEPIDGLAETLARHQESLRRQLQERQSAELKKAAEGVFNRSQGTVVAVDRTNGSLTIRNAAGKLIEVDPQDRAWQYRSDDGKTVGLALQHGYSASATAAQGLSIDKVYVKDDALYNRKSAGVAMSRHKQSVQVYIDKEAVYESMMRRRDDDEWQHIDAIKDDEVYAHVAKTWSRRGDKSSTLDYLKWRNGAGELVHPDEELSLANLAEARAHVNQVLAGDAAPEMPFQLADAYVLDAAPALSAGQQRAARAAMHGELAVSEGVLNAALKQGFVELRADGLPSFVGRRGGDGEAVNRVRDGKAEAAGMLRGRYPPILRGGAAVHVVERGEDALALWTQCDLDQAERPTIIVAGRDLKEATQLEHVRTILRQADGRVTLEAGERITREAAAEAAELLAKVRRGAAVTVSTEPSPLKRLLERMDAATAAVVETVEAVAAKTVDVAKAAAAAVTPRPRRKPR